MGICKLCLKDKQLIKKSHIIPEFMYSDLFDENHNYILTTNKEISKKDGRKRYKPTGEYEGEILCADCDNKTLGKFESYASKTLYGNNIPLEQAPVVSNHFNESGTRFSLVKNIDYQKFKLFLLSILWRASISKRPFFEEVSLGPHEDRLRKMLLLENPGEERDYPIQFLTYVNDKRMSRDFIGQPRTLKTEGHRLITFFIAGVFYGFMVSSHPKPEGIMTSTIKKSNELIMLHIPEGKGWEFIAKYIQYKP